MDVLGVFPDRVSVLFKIKPDQNKTGGEEETNPTEEENTMEPDSNPELLEEE